MGSRTHLRCIGTYLLGVCLLLFLSSVWQIKFRGGSADFSFVVIIPFALGLLGSRKWAIWGTGIIGGLSTSVSICLAVIHTFSPLSNLTMRIGPITVTDPSAIQLWLLAAAEAVAFGIPMMSVLTKLPDRQGTEKRPMIVETAWLVLAIAVISAAAAGIVLWAGVAT